MKIAVFYTGELRTIKKTIEYFKKNILINEDVHVFATFQSLNDIDNNNYSDFINKYLKNNIKNITWLDKNNNEWINIRNKLLYDMHLDTNWNNYLKNSGSMIEYYQMYISYNNMCKYEIQHNTNYDYIIRCRTDIVITKQINFEWLNMNVNDIENRMKYIISISKDDNIYSLKNISLLMNTLIDKNRIHDIYNQDTNIFNYSECDYLTKNNNLDNDYYERLLDFIKNGRYIITLRKNIIYFCNREIFKSIYSLGINYGKYYDKYNNYWWNSESQLRCICSNSNIFVFDSVTHYEDISLYNYDENNYFSIEKLLNKNINQVFFIRRY